jgi:hypothetical protein
VQLLEANLIGSKLRLTEPNTATERCARSEAPATTSPAHHRLMQLMDEVANRLGLEIEDVPTGRNYRPHERDANVEHSSGIGVYETQIQPRGVELNLAVFRELGADEVADDMMRRLREITGRRITARLWPNATCQEIIDDWSESRMHLIEPYFRERIRLLEEAAAR